MSVDKTTVQRIARLARIDVAEDRLAPMADELSHILNWIEQLDELFDNVEPLSSVTGHALPMRGDDCTDGGIPEKVLANAQNPHQVSLLFEGGGMSTLLDLTAAEARRALDKGETSAVDLTTAYLNAAEAPLISTPIPKSPVTARLKWRRRQMTASGKVRRGGWKAFLSGSRTCFALRVLPLPHALISCAVLPRITKAQ